MKKHNFAAGPSILSPYTIQHTAEGILDLNRSGLSVMEISHRSKDFMEIMDETQQLFKELLDIPAGYSVLLLQGGASLQFCMVPYNLLKTKAAYLDTGSWASKAIKEAGLFGEVEVVGHRDKGGSGLSGQPGRRYVIRHFQPSHGCLEVCPDLWRRSEEPGPGRRYFCYYQG